jgi:predicted N-formylglutamate amidohydrolase
MACEGEFFLRPKLILTCEHADYQVPKFIFASQHNLSKEILKSHRGWDQGALALAKAIQPQLFAKLFSFVFTRLLVDANRTVEGPEDLPKFSREFTSQEKQKLVQLHRRYRSQLYGHVKTEVKKQRPILILSIHSFTPVLYGQRRKTDIGLLFRPKIAKELAFAKKLRSHLKNNVATGSFNIHMNLPYRGFTDCCLNDVLDQHLKNQNVNGLFLEVNQRLLQRPHQIRQLGDALSTAIVNSWQEDGY